MGKALDEALAQIEKSYGSGSLFRANDDYKIEADVIPTGCISLDVALGVGGLAKGRIVEIYGPEGSGKSTLALHVVAEAQKQGGTVAYIDAEHALDFVYAKSIGVDLDNMYINQPSTGEEGLNILNELAKTGEVSLIVVDSVAALTPKAEIEGQIGDQSVGMHARMMSQAMRKITGNVKKSNTLVVFINQLREKIGIPFGNPETQPGGRALKFYSSVRLDVRKKEQYKHGTDIAGNVTKVKVVKNRLAPPYREAEFQIEFGEGISKEGDVLDWAVDLGFVNKAGSWYSYNDTQIGQGKEAAKEFLKDHELLYEELYKKIYDEVLGSHEEYEDELKEETENDKSSSELE